MLDNIVSKEYKYRSYGAFELKKYYQKAFTKAIAISCGLFLTLNCSLKLYEKYVKPSETQKIVRVLTITQSVTLFPPPPITEDIIEPGQISGGIFQAVPQAREHNVTVKKKFYGDLYGFVNNSDSWGGMVSDSNEYVKIGPLSNYKPSGVKLVEAERLPDCVKFTLPTYPESAKRSAINKGEVWLVFLIDKDGKAKNIDIYKGSGNIEFDKAVAENALQWEFRAPLGSKEIIPVWILYPISFGTK